MTTSTALHNRNRTFLWDRVRAISSGIVETGVQTFFLFIAIRVFEAGPSAKGLIAASMPIGLLASPLLVNLSANAGWSPARTASVSTLLGTLAIAAALLFQSLPVFLLSVLLFSSSHSIVIPFLTQIYQDNYDETERGRLFTWAAMIRIVTAGTFAWLGGWYLDRHLDSWYWLLAVFGMASVLASIAIWRFPSQARAVPRRANPFHALGYLKTDAVFRKVLIAQMMMGIGMMMAIPLRVEYLASEQYGLMFASSIVALLTTIVPSGSRLVFSPVWGRLFDRINFFALRITLNIISVISLLVFFYSTTLPMLILGMLIFGVFRAGGEVAWSLWVTKIAPPHLVADYMSVHTLLTGVRGISAPFIGFYAATLFPLQTVATISACLLLGASLLLTPELRSWRKSRPGSPLISNTGTRQQ